MTLFEKLQDTVSMGYGISFKRDGVHFIISISTDSQGEIINDESCMPIRDHFTEKRIVECIDFQMARIDEKINEIKTNN